MKKWLLFLIPFVLILALMACDSATDTSSNTPSDSSKTEINANSKAPSDNNVSYVETESNTVSTDASADGSTVITKEISGIKVSLSGESELNSNGYSVSGFNMSVNITVKGPKSVVDSLTAQSFTASVDVSTVTETGDNIELLIDYTAPSSIEVLEKTDFASLKIVRKGSSSIAPPADQGAYMSNGIIVNGNRGMETFGGSAASGAKTAEKLNAFKAGVGSDVNVYILPCPTASAFYAPEKYSSSIKAHINFFGGIRDNLQGVKYVDTLAALNPHTDEYLYFRTDFHWTGLAGYYAASALADVAGVPHDDLSTYKMNVTESCFKGSLVGYASVLGKDPDDVYWYVPSREYTVTYYSVSGMTNPKTGMTLFSSTPGYTKFMYGDAYTAHIESNIGNGRKLLVFKNSYGNALAPYLLSSFEDVYIADIRKFKENAKEFIEEYGITDVCFAISSHGLASSAIKTSITDLLKY